MTPPTGRPRATAPVPSLPTPREPLPGPGAPDRAGRISVVAHRGASAELPEHTLAAYALAVADGADALECDVRPTADGHLVCVHDPDLDRTSDGRGPVAAHTLADLADLDFWTWKGRSAGDEELRERGVLTLERLFELVEAEGGRVGLAIETKDPAPGGRTELLLRTLLQRFGWDRPGPGHPQIRVMSFARAGLRRMRLLAPGIETVWLVRELPQAVAAGVIPGGVSVLGPSIEAVRSNPFAVARLAAAGRRVHVWTVDDPSDLALCADAGADAVITNRPRWARDALRGAGADTGVAERV